MTMTQEERDNLIEWIIASNGGTRSDYQTWTDRKIERVYEEIRERALQEILEETQQQVDSGRKK